MGVFAILTISILLTTRICLYIQNRKLKNAPIYERINYTINDKLSDKLPLSFIVITPNGVVTRVNKLLLAELNLKQDDVVNKDIKSITKIVHDKENVFPEYIEMLNAEKNVITPSANTFIHEPQKHIMNIAMGKTRITKDYTPTMQRFEKLMQSDDRKVLFGASGRRMNGNLYENSISFRIYRGDGTWEWVICMSIQRHKDNENILNEALVKTQRSEEQTEKNAHSLMMSISDILDLSEIESNTMGFNYCDVSLTMLLNDIISAQRINIESGVKLKVELSLQNILIRTNPCRLGQVLNNLINNADKFTEKGYVRVGCRCGEPEIVEFFVEDAGRGMSQNVHAHNFKCLFNDNRARRMFFLFGCAS